MREVAGEASVVAGIGVVPVVKAPVVKVAVVKVAVVAGALQVPVVKGAVVAGALKACSEGTHGLSRLVYWRDVLGFRACT